MPEPGRERPRPRSVIARRRCRERFGSGMGSRVILAVGHDGCSLNVLIMSTGKRPERQAARDASIHNARAITYAIILPIGNNACAAGGGGMEHTSACERLQRCLAAFRRATHGAVSIGLPVTFLGRRAAGRWPRSWPRCRPAGSRSRSRASSPRSKAELSVRRLPEGPEEQGRVTESRRAPRLLPARYESGMPALRTPTSKVRLRSAAKAGSLNCGMAASIAASEWNSGLSRRCSASARFASSRRWARP